MKIRPCIDLHNGQVKQIVGSTLSSSHVEENHVSAYSSEYFAERYRNDHLDGGHIIMLGPGNETAALTALRAFPQGMQIGGGLTPDNCTPYLEAGASHIIVTSYIFTDGIIHWDRLKAFAKKISARRLVLDLSCKQVGEEFYVATNQWQKISQVKLDRELIKLLSPYCDEFLIHAADVEGKRQGIQEKVVRLLAEDPIKPITYAGGIRDENDINNFYQLSHGSLDLTVGSALDIFGGTLPYSTIVNLSQSHNFE
ncbi:phosphoribosylformimino-5-aminoimidazole carboxamide ribotide isomerase [Spirochaeta cellobiosiphila]|uniref:phosphoribosylformimino-5-aminoimidazole carboxamide ribotide isomerase n=1 Tax=Spirochaeta cellobiosiphila TaxID=504483 RepID=UPI000420C563|nr:phosphoribosylformimino-5-aminoimidazole carboxamide ribotide isomerase [Spirochaeta cellobiosiphila]